MRKSPEKGSPQKSGSFTKITITSIRFLDNNRWRDYPEPIICESEDRGEMTAAVKSKIRERFGVDSKFVQFIPTKVRAR